MLNKTKVALMGAMAVVVAASGNAQAATQTGDAKVQIISAVQLVQNDVLDFGVVASSAVGGTVALSTVSNTPACSATLTCIGTAMRGRFTVTATSSNVVLIKVPTTTTVSSGGNNMTIALVSSVATFTATATPEIFYVGGILTVGPSQAAGNYTGTYTVTADYV